MGGRNSRHFHELNQLGDALRSLPVRTDAECRPSPDAQKEKIGAAQRKRMRKAAKRLAREGRTNG